MSDPGSDPFAYGIERHWLDEDQIALIATQGNMSREAVDEWVRAIEDSFAVWRSSTPVMILHDLSHRDQGITNYSMHRIRDLYQTFQGAGESYHAAVLSSRLVAYLADAIIMQMRRRIRHIHVRLFYSREEALAWLRSQRRA